MFIRSRILVIPVKSYVRFFSVPGRATTIGTQSFVSRSNLSFHHCFGISQLYINPIIHGAPTAYDLPVGNEAVFDQILRKALFINRSNCIVIYDNSSVYDATP
jgi:hypothetical protein